MIRSTSSLLLLLALVAGSAACGSEAEAVRPRLVLLYAPCSVSTEFLSPYAPEVTYTPHLQAFADESTVFARHNTEAGQSGTDFAALFCGTQAYRHGVYCHPKVLAPGLFQISEAFDRAGYESYFWSGQAMGAWNLGYGQGVPRERAHFRKPSTWEAYTANDEQFAAILQRLAEDPDYKAFVQVNFTVTHSPYHKGMTQQMVKRFVNAHPDDVDVSNEDLQRFTRLLDGNGERNRLDLQWDFADAVEAFGLSAEDVAQLDRVQRFCYKVKIHELDRLFGKLVGSIRDAGLLDESLIALTADHGEIFYRENADFLWAHGGQLAPEVLQVPWILRGPGQGVQARRYESVTRSIDVFPTMAGLSGVLVPDGEPVDGQDLSAAVRGRAPEPALLAFSHTTTLEDNHVAIHENDPLGELYNPRADPELLWVRVRDGDMVYKHRNLDGTRWARQVFDLASDPGERHDLYDADDRGQAEMFARLDEYKALLVRGYSEAITGDLSSDASLEALQGLGYAAQDG